jgi:hypothetical protein
VVSARVRVGICALFSDQLLWLDPQMQSAKWRIDTYSSLTKIYLGRDELAARIGSHIVSSISAACAHIFGTQFKSSNIDIQLTQIAARALELNHKIKSEVVHLGDLHAEYFHYNHKYDAAIMTVLDADKGDSTPSRIVSTCGLGVRITKAVGGGKEPESSVVLKAVVASEQVYES